MAETDSQYYKEEIKSLKAKIDKLDNDKFEILKYSDMAVVETRADMRIVNSFGAVDFIFEEEIDNFERGESLLKLIYKITRNTRPIVSEYYQTTDEIDNIEQTVEKFVEGTIDEKLIRIIGEKENGELFLLLWRLRRNGKIFISYFKTVPTNAIIQAAQDKHKHELEFMQIVVRDSFNLVSEGITILDLKNRVMFMNLPARRDLLANESKLMQAAPVENRFLQELLINETQDMVKTRLDNINKSISSHKPVTYSLTKNDEEVEYKLYPMLNEKQMICGTIMIAKAGEDIFGIKSPRQAIDTTKYIKVIAQQREQMQKQAARIAELENNQNWLLKQNKEFQFNFRLVQTFLEHLPMPVSIQSIPSRKYEYANKAFEVKFNTRKEVLKDKTDENLFPAEDAEILVTRTNEALDSSTEVKVSTPNFYIRQIVLRNANNNPTHLIRVYL